MKIVRPGWLTHREPQPKGEKKNFEVYSCHVSPDGSRLATAAGDSYVRIWSTEAIYNCDNPSYDKPKQLASMSHHSGTIHTVRFSPNGRYVASGADDKFVLIYILDSGPPPQASFGSNEAPPVENWRIFRRLVGHDNDVQDLGWSHDGTILVSVGLDSKITIWSGFTFEKLKTLPNHQSHVKGITFDPANKYFATASDDRTIKVFRFTSPGPNSSSHDQMNNFVLETTINTPFSNSPLTTYFRRFSWGPDGQHIAAANAVNGPVSSVAIINRGTWDGDISLIGHEAPVEACAFSPRLYGQEPPSKSGRESGQTIPHSTAIACAAGDKSISIWLTSNPRPLIVWQDLASKPFSDLAWTPDGMKFYATALDGTILLVSFQEGELGYPRPIEENERSLTKFGTGRKGAGVIETTNGLLLEENSRAGEINRAEGRMGELMGDGQIAETAGAVRRPNGLEVTATNVQLNGKPNGNTSAAAPADSKQAPMKKQTVEVTKDGKKRVKPMLMSGAGATESSLPQSRLVASTTQATTADGPQSILDLSKPFDGLPKGGLASLILGNKRKLVQESEEDDGHIEKKIAITSKSGATPILINGAEGLDLPKPPTAGAQKTPAFIRPAVTNPVLSVSQIRLAVPKVRSEIVQAIDVAGNPADVSKEAKTRPELVFEARNPHPTSLTGRAQDREPCRITLTRREQPLWQDFLPKTVLLATGNRDFWAVGDETGSIHIWTPAGRRLANALVLEAQPVVLESYGFWLLCITAVGICYVWNIKTLSSPHPPVSLAPVLDAAVYTLSSHPTTSPAVSRARLNSEGRIIIALSNGEGYTYSPALYTWQKLSEVWWAVGSQYWNTTDSSVGNLQSSKSASEDEKISAGIIPFLERHTTNETLLRGRAYFLQRLIKVLLNREGFESFESGTSIAHLENRVAAAMTLGAKEEFRLYLLMYAKRLGAEGLRLKVEELLRTLLGGIFNEQGDMEGPAAVEGRNWQDTSELLCGWKRQDLLKDVILILGKQRDLQRVTVPYAQLLGVLDSNGSQEDVMVT